MSQKSIRIELSPQSCRKAVEALAKIDVERKHKMDELMTRLAQIGNEEATRRFARGSTDGNGGVIVTVIPIENGFKISASGHDVGFIEFGAGFAAGGGHPYTAKVSFPVYPGSYSERNTGEFAKYGSWHYNGEKYQELEAQRPLFYAMQRMRQELPKLTRELFG